MEDYERNKYFKEMKTKTHQEVPTKSLMSHICLSTAFYINIRSIVAI
jgi:hypothetical protein